MLRPASRTSPDGFATSSAIIYMALRVDNFEEISEFVVMHVCILLMKLRDFKKY
jgi:hypothetical protein